MNRVFHNFNYLNLLKQLCHMTICFTRFKLILELGGADTPKIVILVCMLKSLIHIVSIVTCRIRNAYHDVFYHRKLTHIDTWVFDKNDLFPIKNLSRCSHDKQFFIRQPSTLRLVIGLVIIQYDIKQIQNFLFTSQFLPLA